MRISHIKLVVLGVLCSSAAWAEGVNTDNVYDLTKPPPTARCVGTTGTATACVDTTKITRPTTPLYEDCVYTLGSTCTPVRVTYPRPVIGPGFLSVECGIDGPDPNCVP